jgi:hypothetical protein
MSFRGGAGRRRIFLFSPAIFNYIATSSRRFFGRFNLRSSRKNGCSSLLSPTGSLKLPLNDKSCTNVIQRRRRPTKNLSFLTCNFQLYSNFKPEILRSLQAEKKWRFFGRFKSFRGGASRRSSSKKWMLQPPVPHRFPKAPSE